MFLPLKQTLTITATFLLMALLWANQPVFSTAIHAPTGLNDAVSQGILATQTPPPTIFEMRQQIQQWGGKIQTHIVANRGFHNPTEGSFSFFETYQGPLPDGSHVQEHEFYWGFFSERQGKVLIVSQSFEPGLMIELIAWDRTKQVYNFWELIGTGNVSAWHYRGDSNDILADIDGLYTQAGPPQFGSHLRCSGCHTLGGPIMKELTLPHNDWWLTTDKLVLGDLHLTNKPQSKPTAQLAKHLFAQAQDASNLSTQVQKGMAQLLQARYRQKPTDLRRDLRSLFVPMEINLASDPHPVPLNTPTIDIPAGFFVDPRLAGINTPVRISRAHYTAALHKLGFRFAPEETSGLHDSRHAFLVPLRSEIDNRIVGQLLHWGLLDEELIADILAVDLATPLYSPQRQSLLSHLPTQARDANDLRQQLVVSLKKATDPASLRLLQHLEKMNQSVHRQQAQALLQTCQAVAENPNAVEEWLRLAAQRRQEVSVAPTSLNPRGTILEPGFRVIFPEPTQVPKPAEWRLNPQTCRIEANQLQ